jgi:peptidyl-prolyl cis-trans isomerase B (cyclophilin B)
MFRVRLPLVLFALLLVAAVFVLQGCSASETAGEATRKKPVAEEPAPEQPETDTEVADTEPPTAEEAGLYTATYKPNGEEIAVITTAKGVIKFSFYSDDAPNTSAAFIELAQKGFYDGTKFHRVEPNFVVQGGDPLSKTDDSMVGTGGPGYNLKAEFNSQKHLDGAVAMARAQDPDSAGSQFYVCLGAQSFLDGNYTVFGQVTEGMDVVRSIAVGDVMESVTIENAAE